MEDKVPELGYRLEGRATRKSCGKGDMLAREVGFGKTSVSIVLIQENNTTDERS